MSTYFNPIWENYLIHRDLADLRDDIETDPFYRRPTLASESLLMRAVEISDELAVEQLILLGESPQLPADDGFTFLHLAVDEASTKRALSRKDSALRIIAILIENGADPNAQGADGMPLHRAAGHGNIEAAQVLLDHGAQIEARMLVDGELTPLMHAAVMNQPEMVGFLLERGANPNAVSRPSLMQGPMTIIGLVQCEQSNGSENFDRVLAILNQRHDR